VGDNVEKKEKSEGSFAGRLTTNVRQHNRGLVDLWGKRPDQNFGLKPTLPLFAVSFLNDYEEKGEMSPRV
jgi:hypothetical protein